jgi:hypothetical protein
MEGRYSVMQENNKFIKKSFWVHQYEKEEIFLSKMAKDGWHFVNLYKGIPTKYEFVKGEKIDYIYQLDYVTMNEDTEDYHQLFADAGWDEVFSWVGFGGKWYYFRRIHVNGEDERIFTDSESKYQMYEKLWKKFGLLFILVLFLELNGILIYAAILKSVGLNSVIGIILLVLCCCFTVFAVFAGYSMVALIMEKTKIKNRLNQKL